MSEILLRFGSSALLGSLAIAALATWVQSRGKQPRLAHFLWLLVLIKLLVPTWVGVPMPAFLQASTPPLESVEEFAPLDAAAFELLGTATSVPIFSSIDAALQTELPVAAGFDWQSGLLWLWAIGSGVVLLVSTARIFAFHRMLNRAATPVALSARPQLRELGKALKLRGLPRVLQVDSNLSPMLWWVGGKPTVVLPAKLLEPGYSQELRWALAHELGHMKRRDHWVRWVEWLAVVLFWWNPVSWWARRNLRVHEELCCDRLVLEALRPNPKTYASSLLNVVEFLARPKHRPPALASAMNSGGAFEQRLQMILNHNPSRASRWLRAFSILAAAAVLPVGFAAAQHGDTRDRLDTRVQEPVQQQDPVAERKLTVEQYQRYANHIKIAVDAGEMTPAEAEQKLAALLEMTVTFTPAKRNPFQEVVEQQEEDARVHEYRKLVAQLKSAVDSGLMTKEEASVAMQRAERRLRERPQVNTGRSDSAAAKRERAEQEYRAVAAMLAEAVAAGDLTREQAGEKLAKIRESNERRLDPRILSREEYALVAADLGRMVELGQISKADAEAKLRTLTLLPESGAAAHPFTNSVEEHFVQLKLDLEAAVVSGAMAPEEAKRALAEAMAAHQVAEMEMTKRQQDMLEQGLRGIEAGLHADPSGRDEASLRQHIKLMKRYEQLQSELQAAVTLEAMSAETAARVLAEAQAALRQAEENLEQAKRRNEELDLIRRQLEESELIEEEPIEEVVEEPIESEIEVHFSVAATGKLTFRGQEMSLDKVSELVKRVSKRGRTHVILESEEGPTYKDMVRIIDTVVAAGAGEVSISRTESSDG